MWEIYLASIVAGVLIIGGTVAHFWKKEEGPLSEERQPQRRQTAPAADIEQPVKLTAEEKRKSQREAHILSSIIHKKVKSKKNVQFSFKLKGQGEILVLPHADIVSQRSLATSAGSPAPSTKDFFKDDILIKIRSMRSAGKSTVREESSTGLSHALSSAFSTSAFSSAFTSAQSSAYTVNECPICCEDYAKGDDIAWSKNETCCHAYHTDCILEWLMNHDDCPMCRNNYLEETEETELIC